MYKRKTERLQWKKNDSACVKIYFVIFFPNEKLTKVQDPTCANLKDSLKYVNKKYGYTSNILQVCV